jgi:creatinine amidohydrolase
MSSTPQAVTPGRKCRTEWLSEPQYKAPEWHRHLTAHGWHTPLGIGIAYCRHTRCYAAARPTFQAQHRKAFPNQLDGAAVHNELRSRPPGPEGPSTSFEVLTGPEIAITAHSTLLLIPLGAIEQHGPHLPVNTDAAIAYKLSELVASETGGLVAPALAYGCISQPISGGGELFAGTISLTGTTYSAIITDLLSAYTRQGYRRIVILNGHLENAAFAIDGAIQAASREKACRALIINWWDVLPIERMEDVFHGHFPGWSSEHAGVVETSLMMYLAPEMVRTQLIEKRIADVSPPVYTVVPERTGLVDPSGVLRTADGSSTEIGKRLTIEIVSQIITHIKEDPYTSS